MDSEELSILVAPLSLSTQSAVSDRHFLIWEKSAYLAEVSVTDITEIFKPRNPGGTEHACTNSVYLAVFPPPIHENLGTRLLHYQHNYMHTHHQCWLNGNMFNRYEKSMRKPFWAYAGIIFMYMYAQCTVNIHILPENCSQDITQEDAFPFSISN